MKKYENCTWGYFALDVTWEIITWTFPVILGVLIVHLLLWQVDILFQKGTGPFEVIILLLCITISTQIIVALSATCKK